MRKNWLFEVRHQELSLGAFMLCDPFVVIEGRIDLVWWVPKGSMLKAVGSNPGLRYYIFTFKTSSWG